MYGRFSFGFSVVELVIVVGVVAVLVTIGVVGYQGMRNRSNDTAVQSDLTKMGDALNDFYVSNKHYPYTDAELATITGVKLSRASYDTNTHAVQYCATNGTGEEMVVTGKSKSGNIYSIKSEEQVRVGQFADTHCDPTYTMYRNTIHSSYTQTWLSNF